MQFKTAMLALALLGLALLGRAVIRGSAAGKPAEAIDPPDEALVDASVTEKGVTYKVYRGGLYQVNSRSGKWEFQEQLYDLDFYQGNYVEREGVIYRKGGKGELIPVRRSFSEDFEDADTVRDLIGLKRGWTHFTLQSPQAPSVKDYNRLRNLILEGKSDYLDNRVEPAAEAVRSGKGALKTVSVPRSRGMVTAKASLSSELLHFVKGDDVWFAGWYLAPQGSAMPSTLMDLETTWIKEHPGMRIMISGGKYAVFELKWANKPVYRQPKGREILFPAGKWVNLQAHLVLSEKSDGVIELWQDGVKIVDARGQTLPLADSIYNSLEVGLSAFSTDGQPATLYVDDIRIAAQPLD